MISDRVTHLGAIGCAVAVAVAPFIASAQDDPGQLPYARPRETMIPGRPGMAGGYHVMVNAYGHAQNLGLDGTPIANPDIRTYDGGSTYPFLSGDWIMGYAREARGWVEALLMVNLEPLTLGNSGIAELGQSGEGLVDVQHPHLLLHQAMVAFHPLSGTTLGAASMGHEGEIDLSIFAGQGSATIGPPIFMHRASSPGPTVPRKHHKGENPHETSPVLGASFRWRGTWLEASVFGARELRPADSRFYPHPSAPVSFAARARQDVAGILELQVSGERLRDQGGGEPDAWQASASAYATWRFRGWRFDALGDWAIDVPDGEDHAPMGALAELAARDPLRRDVLWARVELNQREENAAGAVPPLVEVSSPWWFATLGFERVVLASHAAGLQLGLFGEVTYVSIPSELELVYGHGHAVTVNVGLHLFGMWMLDSALGRMEH